MRGSCRCDSDCHREASSGHHVGDAGSGSSRETRPGGQTRLPANPCTPGPGWRRRIPGVHIAPEKGRCAGKGKPNVLRSPLATKPGGREDAVVHSSPPLVAETCQAGSTAPGRARHGPNHTFLQHSPHSPALTHPQPPTSGALGETLARACLGWPGTLVCGTLRGNRSDRNFFFSFLGAPIPSG